jgi:hypothetical protein
MWKAGSDQEKYSGGMGRSCLFPDFPIQSPGAKLQQFVFIPTRSPA